MAANLTTLRKMRGGNKGFITKLKAKYEDYLNSSDTVVEKISKLSRILPTLREKHQQIIDYDQQILALLDGDELDNEIELISNWLLEYEDLYMYVEAKLELLRSSPPTSCPTTISSANLHSVTYSTSGSTPSQSSSPILNPSIPSIITTVPNSTTTSLTSTSATIPPAPASTPDPTAILAFNPHSTRRTKLPELKLPVFDGNILQWRTFWDMFHSEIDNDPQLSSVGKFQYLKTQLRWEAKEVVSGLVASNDNYTHAITLLQERYGQKTKIVNAHMRALHDLQKPKDTAASLKSFFLSIETNIRGLEALNVCSTSYGDLLVCALLGKLPPETRRNLARSQRKSDWTLDELRSALKHEIDILESGYIPKPKNPEDSRKPNRFPSDSTMSSFLSTKQGPPRPLKCAFCKGTHTAVDCDKYSTHEERTQRTKTQNICFNCLGSGTHSKASECRSKFRCRICRKLHHTSLHRGNPNTENQANQIATPGNLSTHANFITSAETPTDTSLYSSNREVKVLLKTAIAPVTINGKTVLANIVLGEGSQSTFVTSDLLQRLSHHVSKTEVTSLCSFGNKPKPITLGCTGLSLITLQNDAIPIQALVVPEIAASVDLRTNFPVSNLKHLKNLTLAHPDVGKEKFPLDVLIGADHCWELYEDEIIRGPGPVAMKTRLGYVLSGPISSSFPSNAMNSVLLNMSEKQPPDLEDFWRLESIGITSEVEDDFKYVKTYQDQMLSRDTTGKYVAKLPWKTNHPILPSNYRTSVSRTTSLLHRLRKTPNLLRMYHDIISDYESRGFIEQVHENLPPDRPGTHYLPHRHVLKDSSTTPLRIVFDCSARADPQKPSLNDCLEVGPALQTDLCDLLIRFRFSTYVALSDIEKAFLQISLEKADRDYVRFLWPRNPEDPDSPFCIYRFKVVIFGALSSPFILLATIDLHLRNMDSAISEEIKKNIYVDNVISGRESEEELIDLYREARLIFKRASMNLRDWATNSKKLQETLIADGLMSDKKPSKLLGLVWDSDNDTLSYPITNTYLVGSISKRELLKQVARIFDPLGYLSPLVIRAKILIQNLWQLKLDWDDSIPDSLATQWKEIAGDLQNVHEFKLKRPYFTSSQQQPVQLHVFADASPKAYGAAVDITNELESSFVFAKSRVAPLKSLTLPQLELMALLVAARIAKYVRRSFERHSLKITLWTDSQITYHWSSGAKLTKKFIENRVNEIKQIVTDLGATIQYCPTKDNPADLLTRGLDSKRFLQNQLWNSGPSWILRSKPDVAISIQFTTHEKIDTTPIEKPKKDILESLFNSWDSLRRTTAWILRFAYNASKNTKRSGPLNNQEIHIAQQKLIRQAQASYYPEEMDSLRRKTNLSRFPIIDQLGLFLDDEGIIRCEGRVHNAPLKSSAKHPVLLPKQARITRLIVMDFHIRTLHSGTNNLLTQLRQHYWIPAARPLIRSIVRSCLICKRLLGKPFQATPSAPLPHFRVSHGEPFEATGVDFTGVLYVKTSNGKEEEKVYICLFTCARTRAIHLEIVRDMSMTSFLHALRRFIGRRGCLKLLISDNATTFEATAKFLTQIKSAPVFNSKTKTLNGSISQSGLHGMVDFGRE